MDELQQIWNQVNKVKLHIETLMPKEGPEMLHKKLTAIEEDRKKQTRKAHSMIYMVLLYFFVISVGVNWFRTGAIWLPLHQLVGIVLFVFGFCFMQVRFQNNTLDMDYNQLTKPFVQEAIEQLKLRKKRLLTDPLIYVFCLLIAIHLLVHDYIKMLDGYWGFIGLLYGSMLGLAGITYQKLLEKYEANEGLILKELIGFEEE